MVSDENDTVMKICVKKEAASGLTGLIQYANMYVLTLKLFNFLLKEAQRGFLWLIVCVQ